MKSDFSSNFMRQGGLPLGHPIGARSIPVGTRLCLQSIEEPYNGLQNILQISKQEIYEYLKGEAGYLWHISDMVDYCSTKGYRVRNISEFGLKRSPQSWQYVQEGDLKDG